MNVRQVMDRIALVLGMSIAVAIFAVSGGSVSAGAPRPAQTDDPAERLAERFAPVIIIKAQEEACDDEGEPYAPTAVDIVLDNPQVVLRQVSRNDPVVMRGPSAADIAGLGEGFYLDFPGSSLAPGCIYERDFLTYSEGVPPTVYAHVVQPANDPGVVYLQYWFYWYYNDWNNKHESDWEGITLEFEAGSIDEALAGEPVAVGYSQHEGGERADWHDDKLERIGDHPVVYSSAGSHASYFGSAVYLGRSASEGFGCDNTDGPSIRLEPEVVVLPDRVDDPDDPNAWLAFDGRWGERQSGPFNGPTGPAAKDRWLEPTPWFDELRDSSVVIPAGDSNAAGIVGLFCGIVGWGSGVLIDFTTSPVQLLLALAVVLVLARFLVRRTDWSAVDAEPVVRARRAGQILRAAVRVYRRAPAVYVLFGLVYIPAAVAAGLFTGLAQLIPFVDAVTGLAGRGSGTSLFLAVFTGSIANLAASVVVNAVVAEYLSRPDRGLPAGVDAVRRVWGLRGALLGAFVRAFGVVFVLLVSVVGIPWGIRQLVRYQFLAQAVAVDGRTGQAALDRSSELVRGRWVHTALVTAVLNGSVALIAIVVALVLLVAATGIPLFIFSGLVSLVYALTVPLAAIALTLLFGDAVAEHSDDAELVTAP